MSAIRLLSIGALLVGCASGSRSQPESSPPQPVTSEARSDRADLDVAPETTEPDSKVATPVPSDRPPHTIYRSEVKRALARGPGYLLAQLGPEPFRMHGRFVGWEITRVFPDEPDLCRPRCDLAIGDIILSVNGDRLETPTAFSNMVQRLPELETLEVKSLRNEKRRIVTYTIVDG